MWAGHGLDPRATLGLRGDEPVPEQVVEAARRLVVQREMKVQDAGTQAALRRALGR